MRPGYRPTRVRVPALKVCGRCQAAKRAAAFSCNAGKGDGLNTWCKACYRSYRRLEREAMRATEAA